MENCITLAAFQRSAHERAAPLKSSEFSRVCKRLASARQAKSASPPAAISSARTPRQVSGRQFCEREALGGNEKFSPASETFSPMPDGVSRARGEVILPARDSRPVSCAHFPQRDFLGGARELYFPSEKLWLTTETTSGERTRPSSSITITSTSTINSLSQPKRRNPRYLSPLTIHP